MIRAILACGLLLAAGCSRQPVPRPDHPRLTPNIAIQDIAFRSPSLEREITYRVILRKDLPNERNFRSSTFFMAAEAIIAIGATTLMLPRSRKKA